MFSITFWIISQAALSEDAAESVSHGLHQHKLIRRHAMSVAVDNQASARMHSQARLLRDEPQIRSKLQQGNSTTNTTIVVQYEALCPDSVRFFSQTGGLQETYTAYAASGYKFVLVPYGNMKKVDGESYGGRSCQHKERECYGNAWQTCTQTELGSSSKRALEHIFCLMNLPKSGMPQEYWKPSPWGCGTYKSCVVEQCPGTLSQTEKDSIESCVEKVKTNVPSKGLRMMESHEKTRDEDHVKHVPWVVIDGKHELNLDENKVSLMTFLGEQSTIPVFADSHSAASSAPTLKSRKNASTRNVSHKGSTSGVLSQRRRLGAKATADGAASPATPSPASTNTSWPNDALEPVAAAAETAAEAAQQAVGWLWHHGSTPG